MKLRFIWQADDFSERDWIAEIFSSVAGQQIMDGQHQAVADNCLLIDSYLHSRQRAYYEQFRGKNAWLLHLSDETYEGGYDIYPNFRGVFRNYWSGGFDPRRVFQFPLGYSEGMPHNARGASAELRPYLWSFLGEGCKSSRPEMLRALSPFAPNYLLRTDLGTHQAIGKAAYLEILRNSSFVPCGMGNVNLDSFRVYEALECGAIPIVEKRPTLDYFAKILGSHPLPCFTRWSEAARFVAAMQKDPGEMMRLQETCCGWWDGYKQKLSGEISAFIATPAPQEAGYRRRTHSLPGAQLLSLLRHQTPSSLARRVQLQLRRLTKEGRMRKTAGV